MKITNKIIQNEKEIVVSFNKPIPGTHFTKLNERKLPPQKRLGSLIKFSQLFSVPHPDTAVEQLSVTHAVRRLAIDLRVLQKKEQKTIEPCHEKTCLRGFATR